MPRDDGPDRPHRIDVAPPAPHSALAPVAVPAAGVGRLGPAPVAPGLATLPLSSSVIRFASTLSQSLHPPGARSCSGKSYRHLRYGSWIDKCKLKIVSHSGPGFCKPIFR